MHARVWRQVEALAVVQGLVVVMLFVAGIGTTVGPRWVPALGRATAPVACPHGYARSSVEETPGTNPGWEIECVLSDGTEKLAPRSITWPTLLAYFCAPFLLASVVVVFRSLRGARVSRSSIS